MTDVVRSHRVSLPAPGTQLTLEQIEALEQQIADALPHQDDVKELTDWLAQANALGSFIRRRDLQAPIQGAQRRIEARIGQLLPEGQQGAKTPPEVEALFPHPSERSMFRLFARAETELNLADELWRQSRRELAAMIRVALGEDEERAPRVSPLRFRNAVYNIGEHLAVALTTTEAIQHLDREQRQEARSALVQAQNDIHGLIDLLAEGGPS